MMRGLNDTIARLSALRRAGRAFTDGGDSNLQSLTGFGSNPGKLGAFVHLPDQLPAGAPLVVVLHGCTQTAAGYDRGAGWSALAERHGFAVLLPEQRRANNPNLCFNWYSRSDARRGRGEALSIRQMVAAMVATHHLDPARVFVTGLSAGGAMTSVMLAAYPEVFAGGAIIAGLPFGSANSVPEALDRMRGHGGPDQADLAELVADASKHRGPWPTLSVWHGSRDATVVPSNADAIVEQWRSLHRVGPTPSKVETVDGHVRRAWSDADGRDVIEQYRIAGMGHGTPLDTRASGETGAAGPYMLEVNISSTRHIARFWGLMGGVSARAAANDVADAEVRSPRAQRTARISIPPAAAKAGVAGVIEQALRAAGLMR